MTLHFEARPKIRGLNGIFKMTAIVGSNFWPIVIEDLNFYGNRDLRAVFIMQKLKIWILNSKEFQS